VLWPAPTSERQYVSSFHFIIFWVGFSTFEGVSG
jgi:hypothetical protein